MSQQWPQDPYQRRAIDINAYAPPRRGGGGWWLLALGVVLAAIVVAVILLRPQAPVPAPTPAPTTTQVNEPVGPGMPFTMPGSTTSHGRWEILSHEWVADGVQLEVQVTADGGRVSYGFAAFSNTGVDVYEPAPGASDPEIGTGVLTEGQSIRGHLFLALPRGDATLILTTAQGRQMSALPIPG